MALASFLYTLPVITGSHAGFPVLLVASNFTNADSNALNGTTFSNGGGNLRAYTDATKTTQLPLDVVTFVTGGSAQVEVWVKVPIGATGVTIHIEADDVATSQPAFGSAFGRDEVWVNYAAVWHLNDTVDSTGNGFTLIPVNNPSVVDGSYGRGYDLNGSNQRLDFNSPPISSVPMTMWVFAKSDSASAEQVALSITQTNSSNNEFKLTFRGDQSGDRIRASAKATATTFDAITTAAYNTSGYCLAAGRFITNSFRQASINGTDAGTNSGTVEPTGLTGGSIGALRRSSPIVYFNGVVEEARVADKNLSLDYISTEHENQNNPGTWGASSNWEDSGGGVTASITEQAPSFTEGIVSDVSSLAITATISETAPSFNESVSVELTPSLSINANISEIGPSFSESITCSLDASINASISEQGPSFLDVVSAQISKDIQAQILTQGPSFYEYSKIEIPINITINTKNIVSVKRNNSNVIIKGKQNTIRVR